MAKKPLSKAEVAELLRSPYVASVMSGRVNFTPEFKAIMYEEIINGRSLRSVLEEYGINTEILGEVRIWRLTQHLKEKSNREEGFADLRFKKRRTVAKRSRELTAEARVEQLEHELAYTRQEIEFLKKIHVADLEARKQWESKQRRK